MKRLFNNLHRACEDSQLKVIVFMIMHIAFIGFLTGVILSKGLHGKRGLRSLFKNYLTEVERVLVFFCLFLYLFC